MKSWRQSQILDVIDHEAVASQEVLRQRLQARGIDATQATISRDLKELGLVKRAGDGAYVRPGIGARQPGASSEQLRRAVATLVRGLERVDPLTGRPDRPRPGAGTGRMDRSGRSCPKSPARLAGDDTILLVCRGGTRRGVGAEVETMMKGPAHREAS